MTASDARTRLQSHPGYRWLVLVTVASGMMMAILSSSIVNIALPTITTEFGSSITTMTWVVTIFMIIQATLMPVWGRAGDIYGHKKVFISGLLLFTSTSLLCTFAWDPYSLIVSRGLQAVGASALSPMALAFVFAAFPARERPQALGIMGGVIGAGAGHRPYRWRPAGGRPRLAQRLFHLHTALRPDRAGGATGAPGIGTPGEAEF